MVTIVVVGRQMVRIVLLRAAVVEFITVVKLNVSMCKVTRGVWEVVVEPRAAVVVFGSGAGGGACSTASSMLPMSRTKPWGSAAMVAAKTK
jgi:hypothetical protein